MSGGWDFSCPQYVDFGNLDETLNDNADEWFDVDHESGQRVSVILKMTPGSSESLANKFGESRKTPEKIVEAQKKEEIKSKVLNDLNTPVNENRRQSPRLKSANKENRKREKCDSNKKDGSTKKLSTSDIQPVAKKLRPSETPHSIKKVNRKSPGLSVITSKSSLQNSKSRRRALTLSKTPQVMKRVLGKMMSANSKPKSSEELELEMMKNYREKVKGNHNRQSQKSAMKKSTATERQSGTFHQTTVPKEFNFATDARIKSHLMVTRQDSPKDFASSLRKQNVSSNKASSNKLKVTHPVPFNFVDSTDKKIDGQSDAKKFKSMAEVVKAFHKQTPKRYHTNPKASPMNKNVTEKHMTQPKSPQLLTNNRKRKISFVGHEKQEEIEADQVKNFKFKAKPINENLFKFPTGIKKIHKQSSTKPVPFSFEGDKIVRKKPALSEENYEFHAQPVPQIVKSGPLNCAPVTKLPLTMPKSPAFALKSRTLNRTNKSMVKPDTPKPIRSCHVPYQGVPFKPRLDKKVTAIEPFTFDERDKDMLMKKEEKIKDEIETSSQIPKFKAQLLPSEKISGLPEKHPKPPTNPKPFTLLIDSRGKEKAEKWKKEIEAELKNQRRSKIFKAQPCTVPYVKPFTVKPSQRPLTNISSFELNTDRRAGEREELASFRKLKELEVNAIYEERQKEAEQQEKIEIAELRKSTVHKALPVTKYKTIVIKSSDVELTQPESPNFSMRTRSQRM